MLILFSDEKNEGFSGLWIGKLMAHFIFFQQCVIDTLSPIIIQLVFSQSESQQEGLIAILNTDSPTQAVVEVRGYILGLTKTCSLTMIISTSNDCGLSTVI